MSGADLTYRSRDVVGDPAGALILFHGRGADEHDLFGLFDALDPAARLVGATPRGPLSLPPGGAHWYAVHRVGYPDPATFLPTFAAVDAWLGEFAQKTGVPPERTVLGGFSQGAVMAFACGLGPDRPRPAGILAFSGFIPEVDGFEVDLSRAEGLPVVVAHGTHDPVISVEFARSAKEKLTAADASLTYRESPIPHAIDPGLFGELQGWLGAVVPPMA